MKQITIPYSPRFPQTEIHSLLESHRFAVLVAHRRMGKTVLAVNHLIKRSITDKKERGFYAYLAPFRVQAKAIAWAYLKHYTAPIPGLKINEGELSVVLPNGATIRLFGADNPNSLRGLYFDGVVLDEVAQMKPEVWGEIIRPALADRGGWAVFIGTPKGINLFSQTYDRALELQAKGDPDWIAMLYSVDQTGVIPPRELESLKAEMSENEFRQEFLCDFNAASDDTLIPIDVVRDAVARHHREEDIVFAPKIVGVDVARFGSDASVIMIRQGLVAREPIVLRNVDNMSLADRVALVIAQEDPDAVFIDAGGGQGVIDRLRQMGHSVIEVPFGGAANRPDLYANRRMEMWAEMAAWLKSGGSIPADVVLQADLSAPTYGYTSKGLKILEAKDKLKERIGRSPDLADSLALTFASPVRPRRVDQIERTIYRTQEEYDPIREFELEWR